MRSAEPVDSTLPSYGYSEKIDQDESDTEADEYLDRLPSTHTVFVFGHVSPLVVTIPSL